VSKLHRDLLLVGLIVTACLLGLCALLLRASATPSHPANSGMHVGGPDTKPAGPFPEVPGTPTEEEMNSGPSPSHGDHITTESLEFLDKEIFKRANAEAARAAFLLKYSDPREYVKLTWRDYMPFNEARQLISKDKLPQLYEMLQDDAYAPYCTNVARLIGYISDDPNSVPIMLRYFERKEALPFTSIESLTGKIWSLALIGKIGGPLADATLREAVTENGAARLAKAWIDGQLVPDNSFWVDKHNVLIYIRTCAAKGLVFSRKPENIDIVKRMYKDYKQDIQGNEEFVLKLMEALAINDYIADHSGVDAYFGLNANNTLRALHPYIMQLAQDLNTSRPD